MPTPDTDAQISFEGGHNASLPASRIAENSYAKGVNVRADKGVLRPRFPFNRKKLTFPEGGYVYKFNKVADFKFIFKSGKFQAMHAYRIGEKNYQIVVISGIIFMIDQNDFTVTCLTLNEATQLDGTASRIIVFDAGKYLVLTDFPALPIIIEDGVARRSDVSLLELPVIRVGTYNNTRAFFSNFKNEFSAGDAKGNLAAPNAPITIQEIALPGADYFQEVFQADSRFDSPITAMTSLQAVDDTTGIGSLIVGTKEQVFAYDTVKPRAEWLTSKFGRCVSYNSGIIGPKAVTNVKKDLYMIGQDGHLRSLSASQNEQGQGTGAVMSLPVEDLLFYQSEELKEYTVICYFKNKVFWTIRPFWTDALRLNADPILDVAFKGLAVLNLDNVARDPNQTPAWDGLWTGVRPMDMNVNDDRMFIMSKDSGSNELYEVITDETVDRTDEGYRRPIKSVVYTRDMFAKNVFIDKEIKRFESNISEITGRFSYKVDYKTSDSPNFLNFGEHKQDVLYRYQKWCDDNIKERVPLSLKELNIKAPNSKEGNPITKDLFFKACKRVQLRLEIEADSWQLNEFLITAVLQDAQLDKQETRQYQPAEAFKTTYNDWNYKEFGQ